MLPVNIRKTPRTLSEAFGPGARLFTETRQVAFRRAAARLLRRAGAALLPYLGAALVGAVLYFSFVVGVTGL
ncbi:hypothetical protein PQH03_06805 [Ralstonia insidiosa]|uniref:hypothetical protein n=1 Tax=Ralstonia insidiosa TaxID=190721 RepID=UPI00204C092F|nr:hypothetical protein [Ralstonia insidiosa]MDE4924334.1 hypothetical protein [Ralstonia insidiosa]UNJ99877.1 hypothetical protein MMB19_14240 [Ralstonia insidiosa]